VDETEALAWLGRQGSRRHVEGYARYGIVTTRAFGVPMGALLAYAKKAGKNHELALALWKSGWYEARLLASMVDEPAKVTRGQMDAWAGDFDNWGVCDTVCWHSFEKTPFAHEKASEWAVSSREYVTRAGFALMACLAGHDKVATDAQFLAFLPLIETGARDDRNFVKKAVLWALRRIAGRSPRLEKTSVAVARRLAESKESSTRWIGKETLRELAKTKARTSAKSRVSAKARVKKARRA
jgi:3-methyladenine DNA glycosylase AlkD